MRKGTIRNLLEAKKLEAGNDRHKASLLIKKELDSLFTEKKIDPSDFSVKAIFEETVAVENPQLSGTSNAMEIAEAISGSQFPTITGSIIHATLIPEYQTAVGEEASLVREENATKTDSETVAGLTDEDEPEVRRESMAYEETDIGEKKVTIYMADFGRIVSLTAEAIFNDRTGEILRRARQVGKKGGQHRAKIIIQTVEMAARTAFEESTTRAFVYNGTALTAAQFYAATHATVADKQVNANVTTTALSQTGLDSIRQNFQALVDTKGDKVAAKPDTLLVPPALWTTGFKLIYGRSDPETVADDPNPVQGMYKLKSSAFMSSTTQYFLGDFREQLLWLWVWKPGTAFRGTDSDLAFRNQIVAQFRFNYNGGIGHTDYRFIHRGGA